VLQVIGTTNYVSSHSILASASKLETTFGDLSAEQPLRTRRILIRIARVTNGPRGRSSKIHGTILAIAMQAV